MDSNREVERSTSAPASRPHRVFGGVFLNNWRLPSAAASLSDALREIDAAFTKLTGISVELNLGASSALARQIEEGAPAETLPTVEVNRNLRLTAAELRLLPLLATHLSFREIGARYHLSRHTIKTQAISAYRKLGASCRSDAVQRADELGLIDVVTDGPHALMPTG